MNKILFSMLLILLNGTQAVLAQENSLINIVESKNKVKPKPINWNVSITTQDGQKICYIKSSPVSSSNTCNNTRGKAYSTVTYISKELDEVSVSSGINFKSPVKIIIDDKYKLELSIIDKKIAWTQNIETDKKLINLMTKGKSMIIESFSSDCGIIKDRYSLIGFTAAYEKMRYLCNKDGNKVYS